MAYWDGLVLSGNGRQPCTNISDLFKRQSTDWYDRGLTETVLEALAFAKVGLQTFRRRIVTSISQGKGSMDISVWGEPYTYSYKNALRKLQYGLTVEVGVRFQSAWWMDKFDIVEGQSFTDLPIRTIVYPSHGNTWGSPINTGKAGYIEQLKELVLRNFAEVHGPKISYELLSAQYVDVHGTGTTSRSPLVSAFAFFGPGDLYTALTVPNANKRFHVAGEAISTRHAWVVGVLDSAWRAVYEFLLASKRHPRRIIDKFFEL
ncbi:hypothetical protein EDB19DRAFT_1907688 [Suillus lakei]|nr:hypothetical protein EDB19DRAFT_1907688 [Suillus lakei]